MVDFKRLSAVVAYIKPGTIIGEEPKDEAGNFYTCA
jgi:hypothetical protein